VSKYINYYGQCNDPRLDPTQRRFMTKYPSLAIDIQYDSINLNI